MTFLIPTWLDPILRMLWFVFLLIIYMYLVAKVFELFKVKLNQWLMGIIVFLALIVTQFILESQYRVFYLDEDDIAIKGNGEIVENATNKKLMTTDEDLIMYLGGRHSHQYTMSYSFYTTDRQRQDVELQIDFHETDIETIMKAAEVYNEIVAPSDKNYFSSYSYYVEIVEGKFKDEVSQQIGKMKKDELTNEMMVEIVENFDSQVLNELEKNMFSLHLN